MTSLHSTSVEETMEIGRRIATHVRPDDVIVLSGDLGAGKTQFAKGFARGLGIDDAVTSPTFNILIEYVGEELPLLHFDLYRLDEESQLEDLDWYGMLESGGVSLVEWGERFPEALPTDYLSVDIRVDEDGQRTLSFEGHGARGIELERAVS